MTLEPHTQSLTPKPERPTSRDPLAALVHPDQAIDKTAPDLTEIINRKVRARAGETLRTYLRHADPSIEADEPRLALELAIKNIPDHSEVIDAASWELLDMDDFFMKTAGSLALSEAPSLLAAYKQFYKGPVTDAEWEARQKAVELLIKDEELFENLTGFCRHLKQIGLSEILFPEQTRILRGGWVSERLRALRQVKELVDGLEDTGSKYIDTIFGILRESSNSHLFELAERGVAFSRKGVVPFKQKTIWEYIRPYAPFRADPAELGMLAIGALFAFFSMAANVQASGFIQQIASAFGGFLGGCLALMVGIKISGGSTSDSLARYLNSEAKSDPEFAKFFETIGYLESLLGWANFARTSKMPITSSRRIASDTFELEAKGLGKAFDSANPDYVRNDIRLDSRQMIALTGPTGGGKSDIQRSLCYAIITSECAGIATANELSYTPVIDLRYHLGVRDNQKTATSSFQGEGQGVARLSHLAESAKGPKLFCLDEMYRSTAEDEAAREAAPFFAFLRSQKQPPGVLLTSHNFKLVRALVAAGIARRMKMSWDGSRPTYELVEGISEGSFASSVTSKAGIGHGELLARLRNSEGGDIEAFEERVERIFQSLDGEGNN